MKKRAEEMKFQKGIRRVLGGNGNEWNLSEA
jgi:hypothetical protein